MSATKLALVIWGPILVIAIIGGSILFYNHHEKVLKERKAQVAAQHAAQVQQQIYNCQQAVIAQYSPQIKNDINNNLWEQEQQVINQEKSAYNQC